MVYRSGGKPPEDSTGVGAKSSGAKFISRSQARPLTNPYPSTATSSTTQHGTHGKCFVVFARTVFFSFKFYALLQQKYLQYLEIKAYHKHINGKMCGVRHAIAQNKFPVFVLICGVFWHNVFLRISV